MGHIESQHRKAIEEFQEQKQSPELSRIIEASNGRLTENQARGILRRSNTLTPIIEIKR